LVRGLDCLAGRANVRRVSEKDEALFFGFFLSSLKRANDVGKSRAKSCVALMIALM
jgi:hypothetical protein